MPTPRLPVVELTDAPDDLNGLVLFAETRNLVSARVPSHFKRGLQSIWINRKCSLLSWPNASKQHCIKNRGPAYWQDSRLTTARDAILCFWGLFWGVQQPPVGHGFPIREVSRTHNDTPQSVGLLWMSDQPGAETSTWQHKHSQQTDIHDLGGIRTHNLNRRVAADLRLRPRGRRERPWDI